MCSITAASLALTVVSGVMQYQSQRAQGKAAQAEANYSAAISRNNAQRAEYLATDAINRGSREEAQDRLRGRILIGQMRATIGSSGALVDEGSAGALVIDQAASNEVDALTIRNNAAREAQDFRIRASEFDREATLTEIAGTNRRRDANRAATGTLIGTAGNVASKWYEFDQAGAFG